MHYRSLVSSALALLVGSNVMAVAADQTLVNWWRSLSASSVSGRDWRRRFDGDAAGLYIVELGVKTPEVGPHEPRWL